MKKGVALLAVLVLAAGCNTLPPEDRPNPRPPAAWEKALEKLNCDYYPQTLAVRSRDPLVFAIMGVCYSGPRHEDKPGLGYYRLISVDASRNLVQATRISSNSAGGLHYTASGDLMWFSSATPGVAAGQRFLEVFTAPAGTVEERSLGRVETPFHIASPSVMRGEGCYVLAVSGSSDAERGPYQRYHWLVRGEDPLGSAKPVEGVGRILYWNPVGKYFVTQAPKVDRELSRSRLNCSGEVTPLTGDEEARLASIGDKDASFIAMANGDLVATNTVWDSGSDVGTEVLVFREGRAVERIGPYAVDYPPCPDLACVPLGLNAYLRDASPSGHHFVVQVGLLDVYGVYRVDDHKLARRWSTREDSTSYVPIFLDDNTVLQLQGRKPVAYYTW